MMTEDTKTQDTENKQEDALDEEAEAELKGVPEHLRGADDDGEDAGGEAAADAGDPEDEARISELEARLEEARQDILYAQAEMQNVRTRMEKEARDARAFAATNFARDILSVSDNLNRALDAIPDEIKDEEKWKGLITGIEATGRELETVFRKHGIERVAAMGLELDPNEHQAMMEVPTDEAEPGTIVQEMQTGYTINGRLLRPALVGVAKKPD